MALLTFLPETTVTDPKKKPSKHKKKNKQQKIKQKQPSSWDQIKNLLTCKQIDGSRVHDPAKNANGYSKLGSSCSSICSCKDVVHGNTKVQQDPTLEPTPHLPEACNSESFLGVMSATPSSIQPGSPLQEPQLCACSQCGEVFPKIESLELHQAVRHAVSELGPVDSSRNIVEIIFKSSWLKKDNPICKIERILKVHNTQRTIQRFEDCRDAVKTRALNSARKNPRCAADGNELLRFHCTTLSCNLGSRGSSSLCSSVPGCSVCTIIRHGFQGKECKGVGIRTTASSGRAHDSLKNCTDDRRAMLVCRVIAGRVRQVTDDAPPEEDSVSVGSYDSVAGYGGIYSNLEELFVFNPRAILPCFVVIYKAL
ncbi:hypothetical protein Pint_09386 [Pistacia integerrima]|uniref:Uncharacterized protein n=1 Tax=Pistacia integerrima TaxID=434235 RepID=A0ACC0XX50_9ROSI|nr:hypothetical protein Pint_09386 [Pistacia integerrima]